MQRYEGDYVMAETTTVKGLDGVKVPKLEQAHINAIEKRLVLFGGTTPPEMGVDLANKFGALVKDGTGRKLTKISLITSEMATISQTIDTEIDEKGRAVSRKTKIAELRKKLEEAKAERKAEEAGFMLAAMKYIKAEYGEEKRDGNDILRGYGDRIEMAGKGHLKKIW